MTQGCVEQTVCTNKQDGGRGGDEDERGEDDFKTEHEPDGQSPLVCVSERQF